MAAVRITTVTIEEIDTENIAEAIRQSGIRFTTLSEKADLHEQYVSRLCRGLVKEVPLEVFDRLAQEMVGSGAFKNGTKADVLAVMRGEKVAETVFRPRLVQGGSEPADNQTREDATTSFLGRLKVA